jgi:hypothetical protein
VCIIVLSCIGALAIYVLARVVRVSVSMVLRLRVTVDGRWFGEIVGAQ